MDYLQGIEPATSMPLRNAAKIRPLSLLLIFSMLPQATVNADDWPQWLGPQRDGVRRETGISRSFPQADPKVHWRRKINSGYAGPAIADGRVYIADLIIAKLDVDGYEEAGRTGTLEPTDQAEGRDLVWSHPAFANKSVYARNDKEIVCISLAEN